MFLRTSAHKCHTAIVLQLSLCLSCALLTSCSKSGTPVNSDQEQERPGHISGMGPSTKALVGEPFQLGDGIVIEGEIRGVSALDAEVEYCQIIGSGTFVLVSMNLMNKTGKDTLLVLPAGLSFASQRPEDQNGLIIQSVPVQLVKNASCRILLYTYCINEHRHASTEDSKYVLGPVCKAAPIESFIKLLAGKKVNLAQGTESSLDGPMGDIQLWLWKITDGDGLTPQDKQRISELENK